MLIHVVVVAIIALLISQYRTLKLKVKMYS